MAADEAITRIFDILDEIRANQADHRVALAEVKTRLDSKSDHESRIRTLEQHADAVSAAVKISSPFALAVVAASVRTFWNWMTGR